MILDKKTIEKIIFIIFVTGIIFACFQNLGMVFKYISVVLSIAFPFILGGAIAFLVNIPMSFIERVAFENKYMKKGILKGLKRPLSLVLALGAIIAVVLGVFTVVIPQLTVTIRDLGTTIYRFLPRAEKNILAIVNNGWFRQQIEDVFAEFDWNSITNYLGTFFKSSSDMISSTVGVVSNIFSTTVNVVIAFIFSIYVLLQREKLGKQCRKLVLSIFSEKKSQRIFYIGSLVYRTFNKFVTGQCLEAVILGAMFFIVLSIARMPYALLIGVLIGFTALIPLVGAFIGCAVSAFLILMVSPVKALAFLIIFLVIQQLEGNLIYPHVVGNSVGLPSMWVLVAVTLGGSLFGVVGMLIFIPMSSVLYTLLREWSDERLKSRGINVENYI